MDAIDGRRAFSEIRGGLAPVLEDREVDVAVAEPDTVGAGVRRLATQLRQSEDLFVELGGLCGVVSGQRDVFDPCHDSSLSSSHHAASAERRFRANSSRSVSAFFRMTG